MELVILAFSAIVPQALVALNFIKCDDLITPCALSKSCSSFNYLVDSVLNDISCLFNLEKIFQAFRLTFVRDITYQLAPLAFLQEHVVLALLEVVDFPHRVKVLALIAEVSTPEALMRGNIFHLSQTCSACRLNVSSDLIEALLDHLHSSCLDLGRQLEYQFPFFFFVIFWLHPQILHLFVIYLTEQ